MKINIRKIDALDYHSKGKPGKIEVIPTKETKTQRDLALAYSPGVAEPCREIAKNPEDVYKYTAKGNLVAVITNGTAVLGLGDIGQIVGKVFCGESMFSLENNASRFAFIKMVEALHAEGIRLIDCQSYTDYLASFGAEFIPFSEFEYFLKEA